MDVFKLFEEFFSTGKVSTTEERTVEGKVTPEPVEGPSYFDKVVMAESGGRADAKAKTSSATGHHQFIESTWKSLTKKYGKPYSLEDRKDPAKSLDIMKLYTEENKTSLSKLLKREPNDVELYSAHFLGTTGARKFLNASPFASISSVVSKDALKRNRPVFINPETKKPRTVAEVYEILRKKMGE